VAPLLHYRAAASLPPAGGAEIVRVPTRTMRPRD